MHMIYKFIYIYMPGKYDDNYFCILIDINLKLHILISRSVCNMIGDINQSQFQIIKINRQDY